MFPALNLPRAELKLVRKNEQVFVWCIIRKKQLVLTPEEWVRQHIIHFLISEKNIPIALIAAEMAIEVNKLSRRCDIVVFSKDAKPLLIIECKAPEVAITEKVFNQIAQYNFNLNVDLLMMTNGIDHVICSIDREKHDLNYLRDLPVWEEGL
jgi:type I site-specific restriction-modification system R (restriction) subunit